MSDRQSPVKIYDRDNKVIASMKVPEEIHELQVCGKLFREGDGEPGSFYGPGEFYEVSENG